MRFLINIYLDDHTAYDCFVLWLMSHGEQGKIFCTDGHSIKIETIVNLFMINNAKCSTLKGKPKLIFIQACRGHEKDRGVAADSPNSPNQSTHDGEMTDKSSLRIKNIIPDNSDMLVANATTTGYVAHRTQEESHFVRCIVNVFREFAGEEDLLSMLTMVNVFAQSPAISLYKFEAKPAEREHKYLGKE